MASFTEKYDEMMKYSDPRVNEYFMMSSPIPSLVLTLLYIYAVQWGLPKFMEKRKPFELRKIMLVYNFAMVLLSGYIFLEFCLAGWLTGYSFGCQPVDYSRSPKALRMVRVCWLFYFSKFIELFDTVFFLLRKKTNQVTFLHVFHHAIMPFSWWCGIKFVAGGFGTFHSLCNSWIHFMMYTYYGLAALGPQYQKFLWWKKYMTSMQMTQFLIVCIHTSQLFFIECDYPMMFAYWIGLYALVFLIMFADFYRKAYSGKSKKPVAGTDKSNGVQNGAATKENTHKAKKQ